MVVQWLALNFPFTISIFAISYWICIWKCTYWYQDSYTDTAILVPTETI